MVPGLLITTAKPVFDQPGQTRRTDGTSSLLAPNASSRDNGCKCFVPKGRPTVTPRTITLKSIEPCAEVRSDIDCTVRCRSQFKPDCGRTGEMLRRFNSAPAVICDSAPWNQGGPHCQDAESDKVTKGVTNGTCRFCVARFSSRHVILTTLDGANRSPSPEEAVFPPEWFPGPEPAFRSPLARTSAKSTPPQRTL
jgi:hypothetical protein